MKILVVGASGTIGRLVIRELAPRHEIIGTGRNQGEPQIDIVSEESIRRLFQKVGKVDAIIAVAGNVHWGALAEMTAEQFKLGL